MGKIAEEKEILEIRTGSLKEAEKEARAAWPTKNAISAGSSGT